MNIQSSLPEKEEQIVNSKTIIITGASGNMGQSMVKKFLAEGYKVIGTVVPDHSLAMEADDADFEKMAIDLASESDSKRFIEDMVEKYGRINAAVLTVGGFAMGTIAETSTNDIAQQYKLNFETAYNVARPLFTHMIEKKKGRIFLVGSRPGLHAASSKGMIAYGLAKSLIFRLAELMNDEAAGIDVATNVIVPGTIDTPQNRAAMPHADFSSWVKPEAIADAVFLHCTSAATVLRNSLLKLYDNG